MKSIQMCVNRFDEETKSAFLDLYSKVDAEVVNPNDTPAEEGENALEENIANEESSSSVETSSNEDQETPF